jgi:hypothetical protein
VATAIAVAFFFPPSSGYGVAGVVLALGFVLFVIPYWSDKVTFTTNGLLISNRTATRSANVTQCRFTVCVPAGRTLRFFVFAIYSGERNDVMPRCVIPIYGWKSRDRGQLFVVFKDWLGTTNVWLDDRTQAKLDELAALRR